MSDQFNHELHLLKNKLHYHEERIQTAHTIQNEQLNKDLQLSGQRVDKVFN
jgi:hypothetical protein